MSGLYDAWAERILNSTLQGSLALIAALLLCRALRSAPAWVKVWALRLALLKMLLAACFLGGWSVTSIASLRTGAAPGESAFAVATAYLLPVALSMWSVSFALAACRHIQMRRHLAALVSAAAPLRDRGTLSTIESVANRLGARALPRPMTHPSISSPVLVRSGKTFVIFPEALLRTATPEQLNAAIAHELAHHRNHDLAWSWLAVLTDLLFFFNPLVPLALKELRLQEECAADEAAMRVLGSSPSIYSRTLLTFASHGLQIAGAIGMADSAVELKKRIESLYRRQRPRSRIQRWYVLAVVTGCALSLGPWTFRSPVSPPTRVVPVAAPAFSPAAALP